MTGQPVRFAKSYADFGFTRSLHQLKSTRSRRSRIGSDMSELRKQIADAECRMESALAGPVVGLSMLEIGPGQGMERALYFGRRNEVTTLDTDVIPFGLEPAAYAEMLRTNGLGRVAKTAGREFTLGRKQRAVWTTLVGAESHWRPRRLVGDICAGLGGQQRFDAVTSWSVFEHLADPRAALEHVMEELRPGGIFYISVHLWTCNDGHHDIRSFVHGHDALPLWAHLRDGTRDLVRPSAFLNEWRLDQYRELFTELAPGTIEILDQYEHPDVLGPRLHGALAEELNEYTHDELFTVNAVYVGTKPG